MINPASLNNTFNHEKGRISGDSENRGFPVCTGFHILPSGFRRLTRFDHPAIEHILAVFGMDTTSLVIRAHSSRIGKPFNGISATGMDRRTVDGELRIILGRPSANLAAISFNSVVHYERFLANNPQLRNTTITRHGDTVRIWVRGYGKYPNYLLVGGGVWASKSTIQMSLLSSQESGEFGFIHAATPMQISPWTIEWGGFDSVLWEYYRRTIFFAESRRHGQGGASLRFIARGMELAGIYWDPLEKTFWAEGKTPERLSMAAAKQEIYIHMCRTWNYFRAEERGFDYHMLPSPYRQQLKRFRSRFLQTPPILSYISEHYSYESGSSITVEELVNDCKNVVGADLEKRFPNVTMSALVKAIVYQLFKLRPSKSLSRGNKFVEGFRNLRRRATIRKNVPTG